MSFSIMWHSYCLDDVRQQYRGQNWMEAVRKLLHGHYFKCHQLVGMIRVITSGQEVCIFLFFLRAAASVPD